MREAVLKEEVRKRRSENGEGMSGRRRGGGGWVFTCSEKHEREENPKSQKESRCW